MRAGSCGLCARPCTELYCWHVPGHTDHAGLRWKALHSSLHGTKGLYTQPHTPCCTLSDCDSHAQAAGERAKLPVGWVPAYEPTDDQSADTGQSSPTLATLQLVLTQGTFQLPHDCEFGAAVRAAELWGRAFGLVLTQVSLGTAAAIWEPALHVVE